MNSLMARSFAGVRVPILRNMYHRYPLGLAISLPSRQCLINLILDSCRPPRSNLHCIKRALLSQVITLVLATVRIFIRTFSIRIETHPNFFNDYWVSLTKIAIVL
jgi:hypothetical protein